VFVRHNELKDGLCKINGNGSSMHVGLLSFEDLIPTPMKTSALLSRKQTGESIPSFNRTRYGRHRKAGLRHMVHHLSPALRCLPPRAV
jgi:hypothetical protein